ncbi:hypothetical protein J1N35_018466 [Gossypium stocksii]|uniref:Zinc knuckle CX2CX4HX4C domain-containing protein n=1 Tax=Gossypium stocksii TaxID=47602 RepID=A0A9D4A670_9ROSI|nr:hypothetical protein J1N35_018466 [Gossypium stocksii]
MGVGIPKSSRWSFTAKLVTVEDHASDISNFTAKLVTAEDHVSDLVTVEDHVSDPSKKKKTERCHWVIFGQYLTVRPWLPKFSTSDNEVDVQVVWVRLLSLPESYYPNCLLRAIGQAIRSVVKLDVHTSSGRRRRFVRLAMCVDLRKPLVSKININGHIQRIEYESLPIVCFNCGIFGHNSDMCKGTENNSPESGVGE